jgi:hypothetical protein
MKRREEEKLREKRIIKEKKKSDKVIKSFFRLNSPSEYIGIIANQNNSKVLQMQIQSKIYHTDTRQAQNDKKCKDYRDCMLTTLLTFYVYT